MKNKLYLLVLSLVCVLCCACALVACNEVDTPSPIQHTHTFEKGYNGKNENGHWHAATCEHKDVKDGFEPHRDTDGDGYCDVCDYEWGGGHGVTLEGLELNPQELFIEVGEEGYPLPGIRFIPEGVFYEDVQWDTDDHSIAFVENHRIFGISPGTTTLTATCKGISATCDVRVQEGEPVHTHTTNFYKGTPATCTESGTKAHYWCSGCNELFLDAAATQPVEDADLFIPAGHKYGEDNVCSVCQQRKPTEGLSYALWSRSSDSYAVTGIGDATDTDIAIATEYNGHPVIAIEEDAFRDCTTITSVYVPDSIWSIGRDAFSGCTSLAQVTGAENVDELYGGIATFENTALLNNFYSDTSIDGLYLGTKMFASQRKAVVTVKEGTTYLFPCAFSGNPVVTDVILPDGMVDLGENSFQGCSSLTRINVPKGITSLGDYMFQDLQQLQSVTLPEGLENMGLGTFMNCVALSEIDIPEGVTVIGWRTFSGCTSLTRVTIPQGVTTIKEYAFDSCRTLNNLTLPQSVTTIEQGAFSYCRALSDIVIPEGVTTIATKTFAECTSLNSVNLANVTDIGIGAFQGCTKLTDINFGKVESIAQGAFKDCTGLTNLTVPDTVKTIGKGAFEGCTGLQKLTLPFVGGRLDAQYDRDNVANSDTHFGWIFGATYSKHGIADATPNNSEYVPASLKEVTITQVKDILGYTFYNCTNLEKLVFKGEANAGDWNNHVFQGCRSLKTLIIPLNVTGLNGLPNSLTTLVLPYTVSVVSNSNGHDTTALTVYYTGSAGNWNSSYLVNSYKTATHYVSGEWHYDENGMPTPNA